MPAFQSSLNRSKKSSWMLLLLLTASAVSGCQTGGMNSQTVMDVQTAAEPAAQAVETVATGVIATRVGQGPNLVIIAVSGAGTLNVQDVKNGALLAFDDLSGGQISLAITQDNQAVEGAGKAAMLLLAGAQAPAGVAPTAPVIALVANGAPRPQSAFAFLPNQTDSLAAGLRFQLQQGSGPCVLLAGDDSDEAKVKAVVALAAGEVTVVRYRKSESASAILANLLKAAPQPATVAFLGETSRVPEIAAALNTALAGGARPVLVGHTGWDAALLKNPALAGAIIARPDTANASIIAAAYKAKFGTEVSTAALYGYDVIAVASGIIAAEGAGALTRERLLNPSGFRATTGAFRFSSNGSVERLHEITVVQGGQTKVLEKAEAGF